MCMEENEMPEPEDSLDHLEKDFLSPLEQDAAQMHEMFKALMKADFTERQALQLVAFLIEEAVGEGSVQMIFDQDFIDRMREQQEEDDEQDT